MDVNKDIFQSDQKYGLSSKACIIWILINDKYDEYTET